jgi:hypothetical protein
MVIVTRKLSVSLCCVFRAPLINIIIRISIRIISSIRAEEAG